MTQKQKKVENVIVSLSQIVHARCLAIKSSHLQWAIDYADSSIIFCLQKTVGTIQCVKVYKLNFSFIKTPNR